MKKCLLVVFFLFSLVLSAATTEAPSSVLTQVVYGKSDIAFAKEFQKILLDLKKNRLPSNVQIAKTLRSLKDSEIFQSYAPLLMKLETLSHPHVSLEKFHEICQTVSTGPVGSLYLFFDKQLEEYCQKQFFTFLNKKKKLQDFSADDTIFFQKVLSSCWTTEKKKDFEQFLASWKTDGEVKKLVMRYSPEIYSISSNENREYIRELYRYDRAFDEQVDKGDLDLGVSTINAALNFYLQNQKNIDKENAWKIFISAGRKLLFLKKYETALNLLNVSQKISANDLQFEESLFNQILAYSLQERYEDASKLIEKYGIQDNLDGYSPKVRYWVGKVFENIGKKNLATDYYTKLSSSTPLSFYSIIGLKELQRLSSDEGHKNFATALTVDASWNMIPLTSYTTDYLAALKRIVVWADLNEVNLERYETEQLIAKTHNQVFKDEKLQAVFSPAELKEHVITSVSQILTSRKRFLSSFRLVHQALESGQIRPSNTILRLLFPTDFLAHIKSIDQNVDPVVVLSLIRQESAFDLRARSGVGARGLMQLMPQTARRMKKRLPASHLEKADTNLILGIRYLKELIKRFDGNLVFALAAYNAGEARVDQWRKTVMTSSDPLVAIESIPYKETRDYVKLIYRNIFFYKLISSSENELPSLINDALSYNLEIKR